MDETQLENELLEVLLDYARWRHKYMLDGAALFTDERKRAVLRNNIRYIRSETEKLKTRLSGRWEW